MAKLVAVAASTLRNLGQEVLTALALGKGFASLAFALEVGLGMACRPEATRSALVLESLTCLQVAHQSCLHGWCLLNKIFKLRLKCLHHHSVRVILGQHGLQVLGGDVIIFHHKR